MEDVVVLILASFLVGLRGEETLKIFLGETKEFFDVGQAHGIHNHVIFPLKEIFKSEKGESY